MQCMYCWLMGFMEASTISSNVRQAMSKLGMRLTHPRAFKAVTVVHIVIFALCRIVVMFPRYVAHVYQIYAELRGQIYIKGVATPVSTPMALGDLAMNTMSACLNAFWFSQMVPMVMKM